MPDLGRIECSRCGAVDHINILSEAGMTTFLLWEVVEPGRLRLPGLRLAG